MTDEVSTTKLSAEKQKEIQKIHDAISMLERGLFGVTKSKILDYIEILRIDIVQSRDKGEFAKTERLDKRLKILNFLQTWWN